MVGKECCSSSSILLFLLLLVPCFLLCWCAGTGCIVFHMRAMRTCFGTFFLSHLERAGYTSTLRCYKDTRWCALSLLSLPPSFPSPLVFLRSRVFPVVRHELTRTQSRALFVGLGQPESARAVVCYLCHCVLLIGSGILDSCFAGRSQEQVSNFCLSLLLLSSRVSSSHPSDFFPSPGPLSLQFTYTLSVP